MISYWVDKSQSKDRPPADPTAYVLPSTVPWLWEGFSSSHSQIPFTSLPWRSGCHPCGILYPFFFLILASPLPPSPLENHPSPQVPTSRVGLPGTNCESNSNHMSLIWPWNSPPKEIRWWRNALMVQLSPKCQGFEYIWNSRKSIKYPPLYPFSLLKVLHAVRWLLRL